MPRERILIVEDDEDILELLEYNLGKEGYRTQSAMTGEEGLELLRNEGCDVVLLDLMLPGVDGLDVCKMIRGDRKLADTIIIMLTARNEEADVVTGLELGADDYLAKPFSPRVLLARIKATLRRRNRQHADADEQPPVQVGELYMDPKRFEARINGKSITFTPTEFNALYFLCRSPGRVFTRKQIVDGTQGEDYAVTERSVDVQVVGIRKKLGEHGDLVETVRGVGYRCREDNG